MSMSSGTVCERECNTTTLVKRLTSVEHNLDENERINLKSQLKKILPPLITDFHHTLSSPSRHDKETSEQILRFYQEFTQSAGDRLISASVRSETHAITESYEFNYDDETLDPTDDPLGLGISGNSISANIHKRAIRTRMSAGLDGPNFLWYPADPNGDDRQRSEDEEEEYGPRSGATSDFRERHHHGRRRRGVMDHNIRRRLNQPRGLRRMPSQMLHGESGLPTPSPTQSSVFSVDARPRDRSSRTYADNQT
jgi:hypothetical protein